VLVNMYFFFSEKVRIICAQFTKLLRRICKLHAQNLHFFGELSWHPKNEVYETSGNQAQHVDGISQLECLVTGELCAPSTSRHQHSITSLHRLHTHRRLPDDRQHYACMSQSSVSCSAVTDGNFAEPPESPAKSSSCVGEY